MFVGLYAGAVVVLVVRVAVVFSCGGASVGVGVYVGIGFGAAGLVVDAVHAVVSCCLDLGPLMVVLFVSCAASFIHNCVSGLCLVI